jgi:hypothetical protein
MANVDYQIIAPTPTTRAKSNLATNLKAWALADMEISAILVMT